MRILHTSDWHLGRSFHRETLKDAQETQAVYSSGNAVSPDTLKNLVNRAVGIITVGETERSRRDGTDPRPGAPGTTDPAPTRAPYPTDGVYPTGGDLSGVRRGEK